MPAAVRDADLVIVGGGIIGLATARAWRMRRPGDAVIVLESEREPGAHQSGHNSGVLHAGVYYRPGSLKASLCTAGRREMERFCAEHGVSWRRTGKLVVATRRSELSALGDLAERSRANGLAVEVLDETAARAREPAVAAIAALWVPETGVVDFAAVVAALVRELTSSGVEIRVRSAVERVDAGADGVAVVGVDGSVVRSRRAVVCAGLHADELARRSGVSTDVRIIPFRGEYLAIGGPSADLVQGLVYPVPDPEMPFLGVHVTRSIDGTVHAGPNAILALARHGYRWRDVDPNHVWSLARDRRMWRLARRWWRVGVAETVRSASVRRSVAELRRLVPDLQHRDVVRHGSGVRAQAVAPDGSFLDDFVIERQGPVVHVLNAPSPGATASLAIGCHVVDRVLTAG